MKKWILAFCLFVQMAAFADPTTQLFELFGISPQATSTEIIAETSRLWNQGNKERWEYDNRYEALRPQLWPLFDELHLLQAQSPQKMHYNYALVVGALLSRVEDRIRFLSDQYKSGVQFDQIVFLTGERPLLDSERAMTGVATEREMVEWVYSQSDLPKEIPVLYIDAPLQNNLRPGTKDTIALWLETHPSPGQILLISNQPYLAYQKAIVEFFLPKEFEIESVGPAILPTASVALILDTIAKTFSWQHR